MTLPTPMESEKQLVNKKESVPIGISSVPNTIQQQEQVTGEVISNELTNAGYSQAPIDVLSEGRPNEVLSKIEQGAVEAEIVGDLSDALDKMRENVTEYIRGSEDTKGMYTTKRLGKGFQTTGDKMLKIANMKQKVQRISNLLSEEQKTA